MTALLAASLLSAADSRGTNLDEIVTKLKANERRLLNVKIDCESRREDRAAGGSQWVKTPIVWKLTAWFNGQPGSKARIEFHQQVNPWVNGSSEYSDDSTSVGFDGRVGKIAYHRTGPPDKPILMAAGTVEPKRPGMLGNSAGDYFTGIAFTTFFFQEYEGMSLSELLATRPQGVSFETTEEQRDGVNTIHVHANRGTGATFDWWLDPARGYALLGYRWVNTINGSKEWVIADDHVTKFVEGDGGIWYPTEAYHDHEDLALKTTQRVIYRASKVVLNDSKVSDRTYEVEFPPGFTVKDNVTGRVYRIASTPEDVQKSLDEVIGSTQAALRTIGPPSDDRNMDGGSPSGSASTDKPGVIAQSHSSRRLIAFACAACTLLLLGFLYLLRRRHASPVVVFLSVYAGISGLKTTTAARADDHASQLIAAVHIDDARRISNCAVNCGYITSHLLGRGVSVLEFAEAINAGSAFERDCSLLDLKNAFERFGLSARGYKARDVLALCDYASAGNVLIIRLQGTVNGNALGHFIVAIGAADGVLLVDAPHAPRFVPLHSVGEDVQLRSATNEFLIVSKAQHIEGPCIQIQERDATIDLGDIPLHVSRIEGEIRYKNIGSQTLRIIKVDGPCSCFQGASGTMVLEPGMSGALHVVFDKGKLPSGQLTRTIAIATNDPKHEVVTATVRMQVQDVPAPTDIRLVPETADYGRASDAAIRSDVLHCTIVIPREKHGQASKIEVEPSTRLLNVALDHIEEQPAFDGTTTRVLSYRISWAGLLPDGPFRERVRFRINGGNDMGHVLDLAIRGDSMSSINALPSKPTVSQRG